jgi:integrase
MKTQNGYVYRRAGWWVLRYRDAILEDGKLVRKQLAHRLAPIETEHAKLKRPPKSIRDKAERYLQPVNRGETKPEATQTLTAFVDNIFLPQVKLRVRQSTYRGYVARWESQLRPRCGDARLNDFGVMAAQQVIDNIARHNPKMKRSTLLHLKNLLGLIFDEAERLEFLPEGKGNPAKLVRLPSAPDAEQTYAYSLPEIRTMLAVLPEPSSTICAVAAFAGLRRSELRGLRWEDFDGEKIMVNRSVWEGFTNEPKTKRSKAAVPVIPQLRAILAAYRLAWGNPKDGPMFANRKLKPVNLNNTLNREILPVLNRCAACGKARSDHAGAEHEYKRDDKLPLWHGWHSFRRGLASTLYALGVDDLMVQKIMRHGNVNVTRDHYIQTTAEQSVSAMAKLETAFGALCADRALATVQVKSTLPN